MLWYKKVERMTRVLNVFKVSYTVHSAGLLACVRVGPTRTYCGGMICMARRWMVSIAGFCSFVSAVDQT